MHWRDDSGRISQVNRKRSFAGAPFPSQAVKVPPPDEGNATKILFGIKDRYEKFHAVTYTDDAINLAVSHSNRYIPDRFLPDKAIDLIDEAGARVS